MELAIATLVLAVDVGRVVHHDDVSLAGHASPPTNESGIRETPLFRFSRLLIQATLSRFIKTLGGFPPNFCVKLNMANKNRAAVEISTDVAAPATP